jgi:hypothetical protein
MKVLTRLLCLSGLCWLVVGCYSLASKAEAPQTPQPEDYIAFDWAKDPVDGDDTPFKRIRSEVDDLIRQGKDKTQLAEEYREAAIMQPENAEAQFRWVYAAYHATNHWQRSAQKTGLLRDAYAYMGIPKNPRSFEYARLRFIVSQITWPERGPAPGGNRNVINLGIRLLEKAPKDDFDLRYFGINAIAHTAGVKNVEPLEKSLRLTLELQKDFPKRVEPVAMLSSAYGSLFALKKEAHLADRSLHYSRQYLNIAPENYESRKQELKQIERIKSLKRHFEKKGELKS